MTRERRRYTTVGGARDWIVSVGWDDTSLDRVHWFEAKVSATDEATGEALAFPPELATYRIGEVERPFREYVRLDWDGDREAAVRHFLDTIFRRVYSYIERGH